MPKTRYARSGDVSIAYQVVGDGPRDLVYVPGWVTQACLFELVTTSIDVEALLRFAQHRG